MNMNFLSPTEVFVTDGFPKHTYVPMDDGKKERELRDGLDQKNKVISISGPSKSGKTTLVEKVFGTAKDGDIIYVTGGAIKEDENLWQEAYKQVYADGDRDYYQLSHNERIEFLVENGVPLVIDDYHFIPKSAQGPISHQIKNAASMGLRIVCLSVPHRGDDPIRNNPDLSGRYFSVKFDFWATNDLMKIPEKGFPLVDFPMNSDFNELLAVESLRSPQIMQTLCLESCRIHGLDVPLRSVVPSKTQLPEIIRRTLRSYDSSSALDLLRSGPQKRGKNRKIFKTTLGRDMDVYECLIEGLKADPPYQHLSLDDIRSRVKKILSDPSQDPNIRSSLQQYSDLFTSSQPPMDWDDEKRRLTIIDPHFYFYLRHSGH